jgi:RHS repeat-associated protein
MYDKNGNTLTRVNSQGTTTYAYDSLNRLTGVTLPGGGSVAYKYDPFGRRIEKDVAEVHTLFLNDGDNVLLEQTSAGSVSARYTYGPGIDQPLIMERGGVAYHYLADGAGNVVELADAAGAIVQSYDTNSFGALLSSTGAGVENPYVFAGRALDPETGLYYFRARYYDPGTGRFLTEDPLSPAGLLAASRTNSSGARLLLGLDQRSPLSLNAYSYVNNSPTNLRDPYGLDPVGPNPFDLSQVMSMQSMMNTDIPFSAAAAAWNGTVNQLAQMQAWTNLQNAQAQIFAIQQQVTSTPICGLSDQLGVTQNYVSGALTPVPITWSEFIAPLLP